MVYPRNDSAVRGPAGGPLSLPRSLLPSPGSRAGDCPSPRGAGRAAGPRCGQGRTTGPPCPSLSLPSLPAVPPHLLGRFTLLPLPASPLGRALLHRCRHTGLAGLTRPSSPRYLALERDDVQQQPRVGARHLAIPCRRHAAPRPRRPSSRLRSTNRRLL